MKDPLILPYFERLLGAQDPAIRGIAIEGLARLATLPAINVLLRIINDPNDAQNDEDRRRSLGLLTLLFQRTKDQDIRGRLVEAGITRQ